MDVMYLDHSIVTTIINTQILPFHHLLSNHSALEQNTRQHFERPTLKRSQSSRLRLQSIGPFRRHFEPQREDREERETLDLLHPQRFSSACFGACGWCDVVKLQGVQTTPVRNKCVKSCCRCIPAVDFMGLFGDCRRFEHRERLDSPENIGFTPGPIVGYIDRRKRIMFDI